MSLESRSNDQFHAVSNRAFMREADFRSVASVGNLINKILKGMGTENVEKEYLDSYDLIATLERSSSSTFI